MDNATLAHLQNAVWPSMEAAAGLPAGILNAIASWETRGAYDANAYNRGSGARGVFQLTPIALQQVKIDTGMTVNPTNVYQASAAAVALLQRFQKMFSGQLPLMVAAYNAGEGTIKKFVRDVAATGRGRLASETREYITNVTAML